MPEGEKGFFKQVTTIKGKINQILYCLENSPHEASSTIHAIEPHKLIQEIELFRSSIPGFNEPLASELLKAADSWLKILQKSNTTNQ